MTISINRNNYGYLVLTAIVDSQLVTRKYLDYSKKESVKLFKQELKIKEQ